MLEVYSPDLVKLGAIELYTSLQWCRRWHEPGSVELHLPMTPVNLELLRPENLLVKGEEAAIIESVNYEHSAYTGDTISVYGRFSAAYLDRRVLVGSVSVSDTHENVMRSLVEACTAGERAIEHFTVGNTAGYEGEIIHYQAENTGLADELKKLSEESGLGWCAAFDGSRHIFTVLCGVDRRAEQKANPWAIFARKYENVNAQSYSFDSSYHTNVAYVTAESGAVTVGTAKGRDRREVIVSASAGTNEEMQQQAQTELADLMCDESVFVEVNPYGNLVYRKDYDLGDMVTVEADEWGIAWDARITEINEIYEASGFRLAITIGHAPTIRKIRQRMVKYG